jgi:uncharacterized membrane protein
MSGALLRLVGVAMFIGGAVGWGAQLVHPIVGVLAITAGVLFMAAGREPPRRR